MTPSEKLRAQAKAVDHVRGLVSHKARTLGIRQAEADIILQGLLEAADSLSLAAGSDEVARILYEVRPS